LWDIDVIGQWDNQRDLDRHIEWVRGVWDDMDPLVEHLSYINHIADDDRAEKVRASYGTNFDRLRQVRAKYDPGNLFRMNPNIAPG
jgi:hypothetical protein